MCLVKAEGNENSPAGRNTSDILDELVKFFQYLGNPHPKEANSIMYMNLEGSGLSCFNSPNDGFWHNVAKAANYDEHQQAKIRAARDMLTTNMRKIMEERAEIGVQLASAVPMLSGLALHSQVIPGQMQAALACDKLRRNLQQAQEHMTQFRIASMHCARPLQAAMTCLQAFPYVPDVLAIYNAVADV